MRYFLGMLRRRWAYDQPYVPPKNPFQTFLLVFATITSLPLIEGNSGSRILEIALDDLTVTLWGWCLLIGSTLSLIGMWTPNRHRIFGLNLERAGMILTGGAALIYAYVVYEAALRPVDVRYALAIQLAFGFACLWRVLQITRALRWSLVNVVHDKDE